MCVWKILSCCLIKEAMSAFTLAFILENYYAFGSKLLITLAGLCFTVQYFFSIETDFFQWKKTAIWCTYWFVTRIVSIAEVQVRGILKCLWCGMSSLVSCALLCRCPALLADGDPAHGVWLACSYRFHKQWSVTQLLTCFCSEGLCKCLNNKGRKIIKCWGKRVFRPQLRSNS